MENKRDELEELIIKNLERLNEEEPLDGHFERFEARLDKEAKKKTIPFKMVLRVAAIVVFAFLAVNQAIIYLSPDDVEVRNLSAISNEYSEVEFYYTNAIQGGLAQWEELGSAGLLTDQDKQIMEDELKELDELFKKLQEDLNANPNDERVINAMLEHYQTKLNLINLIISNLREVKTQNETKHEIEI